MAHSKYLAHDIVLNVGGEFNGVWREGKSC